MKKKEEQTFGQRAKEITDKINRAKEFEKKRKEKEQK
jgi:hypothetical protein